MTMTIRGALVGADYVLSGLPKQAFAVRSWQDNVAPVTQTKVRAILALTGRHIESVYDSRHRRYVGFVWSTAVERSYCYREWEASLS